MNNAATAGERAADIIAKAVADGSYTSSGRSDRNACQRLNGRGLLKRDTKDADKWYPTPKVQKEASGAQEVSVHAHQADRVAYRRRIDSIDIGDRLRGVDQSSVEALLPSLREFGLKTPITVQGKPEDERVRLGAGMHRLAAMRQLGREFIDCFHDGGDDLDRELWEIDENLCRSELTAADKALFVARRKEIYLIKFPETAREATLRRGNSPSRQVGETGVRRFSAATAEATGQSERSVQRDAERGERIVSEALHRLRGTRLNSGSFLDRLKQVPQDKQVLYVQAALDEEKQKAIDTKANRQALSKVRHSVRLGLMAHVTANGAASAGQVDRQYPIIYADPPWRFGVRSEVTGSDRSASNHYPTMPTEDICALWENIGSPAKRDAVLFLWATNPMLLDGLRVMAAWGFTYVHHWIWDKEIAGNGYWGRDRHELLLIGRRGDPAAPLMGSQPETVHREAKGRHSEKPAYYAEQIERLYPDMPRLEMFCRSPRPGWTAWGYEAAPGPESLTS